MTKSACDRIFITEGANARALLERKGIRPTRQRISLCALLFQHGNRHLTADQLHQEARDAGIPVSPATVYNTLNQFAESALIRRVSVSGQTTYFDTNTGDHQHFFIEGEDRIIDIPADTVIMGKAPTPPEGYIVSKVDVVVHLVPANRTKRKTDWPESQQPDEQA